MKDLQIQESTNAVPDGIPERYPLPKLPSVFQTAAVSPRGPQFVY